MTIQAILNLIITNKDLITTIFAFFFGICATKENLENVKKQAILFVENLNADNNLKLSSIDKLNLAVDYFYEKFMTRFVPGWLLYIFFPKTKVQVLIQNEFNKLIVLGKNKIEQQINNIGN